MVKTMFPLLSSIFFFMSGLVPYPEILSPNGITVVEDIAANTAIAVSTSYLIFHSYAIDKFISISGLGKL